ncbi:hypothetical protein NB535_10165, partial [Vibrio parahaemolyticus]
AFGKSRIRFDEPVAKRASFDALFLRSTLFLLFSCPEVGWVQSKIRQRGLILRRVRCFSAIWSLPCNSGVVVVYIKTCNRLVL